MTVQTLSIMKTNALPTMRRNFQQAVQWTLPCEETKYGRYLSIQRTRGAQFHHLALCEVMVNGRPLGKQQTCIPTDQAKWRVPSALLFLHQKMPIAIILDAVTFVGYRYRLQSLSLRYVCQWTIVVTCVRPAGNHRSAKWVRQSKLHCALSSRWIHGMQAEMILASLHACMHGLWCKVYLRTQ